MRNRCVTVAAVASLALSACTSEDKADGPTTTTATEEAAATSAADGLEGTASENGWFCRYIGPNDVKAALGGEEPVTPRERQAADDEVEWTCEVLTGGKGEQEPAVRLTIVAADTEQVDALKASFTEAEGVETGPEHLGESYTLPGRIGGFLPCTAPDATRREDRAPYAVVVESLGAKDEAADQSVRKVAGRIVVNLDQTIGCSPKAGVEDAAATSAP